MYQKNIFNKPIFENVEKSSKIGQIYYEKKTKTYILCQYSTEDCEHCYFGKLNGFKNCEFDSCFCYKNNIIYKEETTEYKIIFSEDL